MSDELKGLKNVFSEMDSIKQTDNELDNELKYLGINPDQLVADGLAVIQKSEGELKSKTSAENHYLMAASKKSDNAFIKFMRRLRRK